MTARRPGDDFRAALDRLAQVSDALSDSVAAAHRASAGGLAHDLADCERIASDVDRLGLSVCQLALLMGEACDAEQDRRSRRPRGASGFDDGEAERTERLHNLFGGARGADAG